MELNSYEQQQAKYWMLGAGLFALALSIFLYCSDEYLTNSPREHILEQTLIELRSAQALIDDQSINQRISP